MNSIEISQHNSDGYSGIWTQEDTDIHPELAAGPFALDYDHEKLERLHGPVKCIHIHTLGVTPKPRFKSISRYLPMDPVLSDPLTIKVVLLGSFLS